MVAHLLQNILNPNKTTASFMMIREGKQSKHFMCTKKIWVVHLLNSKTKLVESAQLAQTD